VWEWYNIKSWCTCWRKKKVDNESAVATPNMFAADDNDVQPEPAGYFAPTTKMQTDANGSQAVHNIEEYRKAERWLHDVYGPAIFKYKWFSAAGFAIFFIICAVFASTIEVSNEPTKWIPDSDPLQETFDIESDHFSGASVIQVNILSGLNEIDRKGTNQFNGDDIGNPRFVSGYNVSSQLAQTTYVSNCEAMLNWDYLRTNTATNETGVFCPMIEFKNYVEDVLNESFPVPASLFIEKLLNFTEFTEQEEGPGLDASLYKTLGDRENRRSTLMSIQQTIRFHRGDYDPPVLAYMVTVINTTIGFADSASEVEPVFDYFKNEIKALGTTTGYDTTFQTTQKYLWMRLERGLVRDAVTSIFVSLLLTFIIVSISTRDLRLSLTSTLSIGMIVMTMIANIVWLGWKISVIESICLTILVGLSVDYTIHLANAWQSNSFTTDRAQRLNATLLEIGMSVLAAGITTFLSAIPLLLTIVSRSCMLSVWMVGSLLSSCAQLIVTHVSNCFLCRLSSSSSSESSSCCRSSGRSSSPLALS
jgi:hypothetical protein